jgi:hypothetical protein
MPKFKFQIKSKDQMSKILIWEFDIDLAFACLPQAGILTFEIMKCPR